MSNKEPSREGKLSLDDAVIKSPEFRASQVRRLYANSRAGTMGALLGIIVVALAIREHVPHIRLITWIAIYVALQVPRYYLLRTFSDRNRSAADIIQWGRTFSFLTFLCALVWGSTAIFMFPADSSAHQMLVVIALAGISSAAAVVYSPLSECYVPAVIAILSPLPLRYFYEGGETNVFIGIYILLFIGVLLIVGRLTHRFVINSLKLQFDKTDLVESLSEQKRVTDILNQELMAEITVRKHVEEQLRVETEKFKMLSDSAPFGMVMIGKDGTFEYLNPKFTEIVGYDLSDVPNGREWIRKAYPDREYSHEVVSAWFKALKEHCPGETRSGVFEVTCRDGSQRTIHFRTVKLNTGEDLMTCEDITEKKRSEEELQTTLRRFYTILSSMYAGVLLVTEDGLVEFANQAFCDLWDIDQPPASLRGLTSSEVIQKVKNVATQPEAVIRVPEIIAELLPGRGQEVAVEGGRTYLRDFIPILVEGKRYGRLWHFQDITKIKQAEQALREANEIFYTFADQLPAVVFIKDHDSRAEYVNEYMKEVFDCHDWVGREASEYFAPDVAEAFSADDQKALLDGPVLREEWIPDKRGVNRLWETRKFPIHREGKPPLLGGVSIDITERKEAEEKLLQEKAISDTTIDSLPGTFYVFDDELKLLRWNKNLEKLTGYSADEISEMSPLDFFGEGVKSLIKGTIEKAFAEGAYSIEADIATKQGIETPYWFTGKLVRLGEKQCILGLGMDLTERRLAEEALVRAKTEWERTFDAVPDLIMILDDQFRIIRANQATANTLGVTAEQVVGATCYERIHGEKYPPPFCPHAKLLADGKPYSTEVFEKRLGGTFEVSVSPLRNSRGELTGSVHVAHNITNRKRAEEALRESEARYRDLFENSSDIIYTHDLEGKFTSVNEAGKRILGYPTEEYRTFSFRDILDPEYIPIAAEQLRRKFQNGIERTGPYELLARHKDGTLHWFEVTSRIIKDQGKPLAVHGTARDITDRKRDEERLKASLREKEVLLKEIHHRVKNNLQLMSSLLRLQLRQIKRKDDGLVGVFEDIQSRIRAMALVHEALYRSKDLEQVDAAPYIRRIVAGLRASSPRGSRELSIKTDVKSISLSINAALACGLIVNELVTNSLKHAFPEGQQGEILVTLGPVGEEEFQLGVRDNGIGMPQTIDLQNPESLGLDLVASLSRQLNGTVEFATGEGTKFYVRFQESRNHGNSGQH
ncbi:MAG TPA: PAS domain S-box protein [Desulfomonilaceae bacterium]|nr:PAS domain S-box protein [Desulfomonilaceae bacterium]